MCADFNRSEISEYQYIEDIDYKNNPWEKEDDFYTYDEYAYFQYQGYEYGEEGRAVLAKYDNCQYKVNNNTSSANVQEEYISYRYSGLLSG